MHTAIEDESWGVAISCALDALAGAIAMESGWRIKEALAALIQAIDQGGEFTKSEMEETPALLKKIPDKFRELAEQVAQKLPKAKIFKSAS